MQNYNRNYLYHYKNLFYNAEYAVRIKNNSR